MPILTVMNQKGGVGKTTSALNLAAALQERGRKVLMVDFDPQGSLTACCGLADSNQLIDAATVADAVLTTVRAKSDRRVSLRDVIVTTPAGIDLAPASQDLATAEATLYTTYGREYALRDTLTQVKDLYDVVLIDGVPTLGLLAVNGLAAADGLIIPVQAEYLAVYGLAQLLHNVELVRERLNPRLKIWGILLTMVDTRTKHSREVIATVRETFAGQVPVFETHIPVDVKLKESAKAGLTVFAYDSASRATRAYRELASEVEALFDQPPSIEVTTEDEATLPAESGEPAVAVSTARIDADLVAIDTAATDLDGHAEQLSRRSTAQSTRADEPNVSTPNVESRSNGKSSNGVARSIPYEANDDDERSNGTPQPQRRHSPTPHHTNDILPPSLRRRVEASQGTGSFPWLTEAQPSRGAGRDVEQGRPARLQPVEAAVPKDNTRWRARDSQPAADARASDTRKTRDEQRLVDNHRDERELLEERESAPTHDADDRSSWPVTSEPASRPETDDISQWTDQEPVDGADAVGNEAENESWSSPEELADLRRRLDAFVPATLKRATETNWGASTFSTGMSGSDGKWDDRSDEETHPAPSPPSDSKSATDGVPYRAPASDPGRTDGSDQVLRSTRWEPFEATSGSGDNGPSKQGWSPDAATSDTSSTSRSGHGVLEESGPRSGGTFQSPAIGPAVEPGSKSNGAARLTPASQSVVVCPYLGLADNRNNHRSEPCAEHRCYAKSPPIEVNGWQQSTYCLGGRNGTCVHFLQARVQVPTGASSSLFGRMRSAFKGRADGH